MRDDMQLTPPPLRPTSSSGQRNMRGPRFSDVRLPDRHLSRLWVLASFRWPGKPKSEHVLFVCAPEAPQLIAAGGNLVFSRACGSKIVRAIIGRAARHV